MNKNTIYDVELIHLQLTRGCNLRCYFCGQWGQKGFFSNASGKQMEKEEWFGLADELKQLYAFSEKPSIMLWGGEPLCCPFFDELCLYLHEAGFALGMVTNGTMLAEHAAVISRCMKKIYISIDGPQEIHDAIRGKGVFERARKGRLMLTGPEVILMSVLTQETQGKIGQLVEALAVFQPDEVYLQQQIGLTEKEVEDYEAWMMECFGEKVPYIRTWMHDDAKEKWLEKQKRLVTAQLSGLSAPFPVTFLSHRQRQDAKRCLSPWKHIHVAWNGNVLYCTDFYDFRAGNVREEGLEEIFSNERSEKFRQAVRSGKCPTCSHCSWRNNETFRL